MTSGSSSRAKLAARCAGVEVAGGRSRRRRRRSRRRRGSRPSRRRGRAARVGGARTWTPPPPAQEPVACAASYRFFRKYSTGRQIRTVTDSPAEEVVQQDVERKRKGPGPHGGPRPGRPTCRPPRSAGAVKTGVVAEILEPFNALSPVRRAGALRPAPRRGAEGDPLPGAAAAGRVDPGRLRQREPGGAPDPDRSGVDHRRAAADPARRAGRHRPAAAHGNGGRRSWARSTACSARTCGS